MGERRNCGKKSPNRKDLYVFLGAAWTVAVLCQTVCERNGKKRKTKAHSYSMVPGSCFEARAVARSGRENEGTGVGPDSHRM